MSNNLPLYPLLRRDRKIDIIVCFDASADIKQENWLSVAEGYAKQRGVRGWPVGAGWPEVEDETKTEVDAADAATAQQAAGKIAETREEQRGRFKRNYMDQIAKNETKKSGKTDLGYCNGASILELSSDQDIFRNFVFFPLLVTSTYTMIPYTKKEKLTRKIAFSLGWHHHRSQGATTKHACRS